jgi:hypothetical protein
MSCKDRRRACCCCCFRQDTFRVECTRQLTRDPHTGNTHCWSLSAVFSLRISSRAFKSSSGVEADDLIGLASDDLIGLGLGLGLAPDNNPDDSLWASSDDADEDGNGSSGGQQQLQHAPRLMRQFTV